MEKEDTMSMFASHRFHLIVSSSHDEEVNPPGHFLVELTREQAAYYLRRMALFENIFKVDENIVEMIFEDAFGSYSYGIDGDGNPTQGSLAKVNRRRLYLNSDSIHWVSYHPSSEEELVTDDISRFSLENLSKGLDPNELDPNDPNEPTQDEDEDDGSGVDMNAEFGNSLDLPSVPLSPLPQNMTPPLPLPPLLTTQVEFFDPVDYDAPEEGEAP